MRPLAATGRRAWYVLVAAGGSPWLVEVLAASPEEARAEAERGPCPEAGPQGCRAVAVFEEGQLAGKRPYAHVRVRCKGRLVVNRYEPLASVDELDEVDERYAEEYRGCLVSSVVAMLSDAEREIATWLASEKGLDEEAAQREASRVIDFYVAGRARRGE